MSGFNRKDFLPQIKIPTVIIHGKKDRYFPVQNGIYMASIIPNCELHLLPKADHIIVLNNFSEVSEIIDSFAKKIKADARPILTAKQRRLRANRGSYIR